MLEAPGEPSSRGTELRGKGSPQGPVLFNCKNQEHGNRTGPVPAAVSSGFPVLAQESEEGVRKAGRLCRLT